MNTIEVLKEELELNSYGGRKDLDFALKEALSALEGNDCVAFGYWLVNAPKKELYSKKWIEQKYQQYIKERKEIRAILNEEKEVFENE